MTASERPRMFLAHRLAVSLAAGVVVFGISAHVAYDWPEPPRQQSGRRVWRGPAEAEPHATTEASTDRVAGGAPEAAPFPASGRRSAGGTADLQWRWQGRPSREWPDAD